MKKLNKVTVKKKCLADFTLREWINFCNKHINDCKECPLKELIPKNWELNHCINGYCYNLLGIKISSIQKLEFVNTCKIDERIF